MKTRFVCLSVAGYLLVLFAVFLWECACPTLTDSNCSETIIRDYQNSLRSNEFGRVTDMAAFLCFFPGLLLAVLYFGWIDERSERFGGPGWRQTISIAIILSPLPLAAFCSPAVAAYFISGNVEIAKISLWFAGLILTVLNVLFFPLEAEGSGTKAKERDRDSVLVFLLSLLLFGLARKMSVYGADQSSVAFFIVTGTAMLFLSAFCSSKPGTPSNDDDDYYRY